MTKKEFEDWQKETAGSKDKWQIDLVHNKPTDTLIYKGGESGHYIYVIKDTVVMGTYEGAIPHIGEAMFTETGRVVCQDNEDAWARLLRAAGMEFLKDLVKSH